MSVCVWCHVCLCHVHHQRANCACIDGTCGVAAWSSEEPNLYELIATPRA